jgi:hypothetical protein
VSINVPLLSISVESLDLSVATVKLGCFFCLFGLLLLIGLLSCFEKRQMNCTLVPGGALRLGGATNPRTRMSGRYDVRGPHFVQLNTLVDITL